MGNGESLQHKCRQGHDQCKARYRDSNGMWHPVGVERPDSLCSACESDAFKAIRLLGDDYRLLGAARTIPKSTVSGPKVSGSGEMPIPIPLGVDTLMSDMDIEVTRWALRVTRGDELTSNPSDQVLECLRILCSRLGTLIDLPMQTVIAYFPHPEGGDVDGEMRLDGVDAVLRLAAFHDRTIKVLGLEEPSESWMRESCHVCGRQQVFSSLSESLVRCRSCRNVWDQDEFMRLNNPFLVAA